MGDANEDSNSSSWPVFYGEKTLTNNHYYNGFIPRIVADAIPGCDKEALKQRILEHEAIFKNQVYELHRLYSRQRDMMEEIKRNENHKHTSFNSCARPSIFGADISNSSLSSSKGNNNKNNCLKDCEIMESRPLKVRKKFFDLELPPDDHEHEEHEENQCKQASEESSFRRSSGLADLNEPLNVEEPIVHGSVYYLGPSSKQKGSTFHDPTHDLSEKSQSCAYNPFLLNTRETGNNMNFTPGTYPEISTNVQDNYIFTPMPFPTLCTSSSVPYMNPADLGPFREKSNGSLTHKLTSFHKQPAFLSSPQSHMSFEDKWRMNGFNHGSSFGSKNPCSHLPSSGLDHQKYNSLDDRSKKIFNGSNFIDLTDTNKGIDLNNDSNSSRKCEQTVPPWLQARPNISKNEKNFGFSVFGNSCISKNESSSLVSTSASLRRPHENGKIKTEIENRGFDINVAWDDHANEQIDVEDCNMGKKSDKEVDKIKNNFDLNSCLTEDADVIVPEKPKRMTMEIDLESPAVPEAEEEETIDEVKKTKTDCFDDELIGKVAAEAIVAMTRISGQQEQAGSPSEVALCSDVDDRLVWFAEAIENTGVVSNETDEFEELTLQQELTKEEDYMPKPLAPDFREPDETGPLVGPNRLRRGQTRRGRPKRDFQRDILPGLVSLSRHEVTEDLQIFGGLMRATGHSWNAGMVKRNGTKGRRKFVAVAVDPPPTSVTPPPPPPPPPPLSGWGNTARRPRRQRCAAGTTVVVPLT